MKQTATALLLSLVLTPFCTAQVVVPKADVTLAFDITAEGQRYQPTWGLDQAWINRQNMQKGINHMGKENIGIARTCFRTVKALINDSTLPGDATSKLRERNTILNLASPTLPLVLTADQEAGSDSYFVVNKSADVNHWAANINSHVHWLQQNTKHPVVGVSPFNEPDYWTTEEGATVSKQVQVARRLKEQYPRMDTVNIVGGNTLNDDKALEWYTSGKQYYDWGNTHQLAGSFDNFAKFYQQLRADGKVGYADEMHNVGEAMVGLEYGMTVGIWWGFDSRARGEFCDISRHGARLAYGEHRSNWTAASVYRHDDGRVKAFIGSSERQAVTTSYQFVSLDRDVYFDGHGPLRQFRTEIPGGTGYQKGQTNAERVIDVTWGEDVAPTAITTGTYHLVNKQTGGSLAYTASGSNIIQQTYAGTARQKWTVKPCTNRSLGDLSFYDMESADNPNIRLNVSNYSTATADIIAWTQDAPTSNEQWYLVYAGDGYYYIRNRESALYLGSAGDGRSSKVTQAALLGETYRNRQLWRILPADVAYETDAPAQPQGLAAEALSAAIRLTWETGAEADLDGYMVLRCQEGTSDWNTIARHATPPYTDNTCQPGHNYLYKVKAIDLAQNLSEASAEVSATAPDGKTLVARWTMDGELTDATPNGRHLATAASPTFADNHQEGTHSLQFNNSQYAQLPVLPAFGQQGLSVGMWVYLNSAAAWQRLFDFGYDTGHYLFLTPRTTASSSTAKMRLAIKNGADEQTLDCPTGLPSRQWKHVVVTLAPGHAAIYVDGELTAETDAITISPADLRPIVNYLGRSQFNSDPFFNGNMDDVCIYNYALSAQEVGQLFAGTLGIDDTVQETQQPRTVYSLDGRRMEQPRRGLNIIDGHVIWSGKGQ